jgi:hypothetical protein
MAKSKKTRQGKATSTRKAATARSKAAEYVGHLLELHKLQGILLNRLDKQV